MVPENENKQFGAVIDIYKSSSEKTTYFECRVLFSRTTNMRTFSAVRLSQTRARSRAGAESIATKQLRSMGRGFDFHIHTAKLMPFFNIHLLLCEPTGFGRPISESQTKRDESPQANPPDMVQQFPCRSENPRSQDKVPSFRHIECTSNLRSNISTPFASARELRSSTLSAIDPCPSGR